MSNVDTLMSVTDKLLQQETGGTLVLAGGGQHRRLPLHATSGVACRGSLLCCPPPASTKVPPVSCCSNLSVTLIRVSTLLISIFAISIDTGGKIILCYRL